MTPLGKGGGLRLNVLNKILAEDSPVPPETSGEEQPDWGAVG